MDEKEKKQLSSLIEKLDNYLNLRMKQLGESKNECNSTDIINEILFIQECIKNLKKYLDTDRCNKGEIAKNIKLILEFLYYLKELFW
ncbi:MAG: hypothetical protein GY797_39790 [Deltaproteobacteria bacterium]|nr:hypothetical protein [Deltaproteobacteria bacterium]